MMAIARGAGGLWRGSMASKPASPSPLATPLGTTLVVVCVTGAVLAGAAALSDTSLAVGALVGIACGLVGVSIMHRRNR